MLCDDFDIKNYLQKRADMVSSWLRGHLPYPEGHFKEIAEAMRYSALANGKRIRPILLMAAADAVGGSGEDFIDVGASIECIHTYSLIHDDLPAMDDDDLRRGAPTCHKVFGEAMAILAGDALLNFAFEILTDLTTFNPSTPLTPSTASLDASLRLQIIRIISRASGIYGMVGGQAMDVIMEGRDVDPETLSFIHSHKTGALIRASIECGAMLGGGSKEEIARLREFGGSLGLLFQIKDDLLDVEGDEAVVGKRLNKDAGQKKATYPSLFGIERTKQRANELLKKCLALLEPFSERAIPLRAIAEYIMTRVK